jgi:hypothetical protein
MASTIDLSGMDEVEAWKSPTGGILAAGTYLVACTSAEVGKSSTQKAQIEVELEADSGIGSIRDWITVTDKSLGRVKAILIAFGIEPEQIANLGAFDVGALVGRKVSITVIEKPNVNDPSKMRSEITTYRPASDHPGDSTAAPAAAGPSTGPADTSGLPF